METSQIPVAPEPEPIPVPPRNSNLFPIIGVLVLIVAVTIIAVVFLTQSKSTRNIRQTQVTPSPIVTSDKNFYENAYFGLKVAYPKTWYHWLGDASQTPFFATFPGQGKESSTIGGTDVMIHIFPESLVGAQITLQDGPEIGGVISKVIHSTASATLGSQIQYKVLWKNQSYIINVKSGKDAAPSTSDDILRGISFLPISKYKTSISATSDKNNVFISETYGYTFEYPKNVTLKKDELMEEQELVIESENVVVSIPDAFYQNDTGSVEGGLKEYASVNQCLADGPTGSLYCDPEHIQTEPYTNPRGTKGYKISRVKTDEYYLPEKKTVITNEVLYAYPLDIPGAVAVVFGADINSEKDSPYIKQLADTFQYLKKE